MRRIATTSFLLSFLLALPVNAVTLPEQAQDESFSGEATTDGKKFVDQMRKYVAGFNDYSIDSTVFMYKPQPQPVGGGNILWKKINLYRLTVKSKGVKDGSVVVRTPDGKLKAWGGPKLSFLKMNLTEDSRLLQVPNGFNAMKSDLGNLLAKLDQSLNNGNKAKVTTEAINVPRLKESVYVLRIFKPSDSGDTLSDQIFVSKANNIPVEWDIFRDGQRYSVAVFENFKGNIGIDDSQFQL